MAGILHGLMPDLLHRGSSLPLTADDFRKVMGQFATGVTIITAAHGKEHRGMTANSVCSVSLEPLSVLVCVNRTAHTHHVIAESGAFCVNILSDSQEQLSRVCAKPDTPEAELKGVSYRLGETGSPVLEDIVAYVDCRVAASFEFGTHTIFVGEAVDLGAEERRPLMFYRGRYASLAEGTFA
ncbi:MAG: 4-nitrophenol 2-monooxygenase / 4-nitrocatechol 4-monooxygenase, reductase component [Chloroflexota bacterium]|jgi:flavin reductase (DIM6/NTAB) family NADH-FMN oxidoreductase RutF|nr:4-nitrophenol 2-monooxygenase / 4-nitrocatechol 4-monooxygenase, reductase component [Chloroflexota bacterium]